MRALVGLSFLLLIAGCSGPEPGTTTPASLPTTKKQPPEDTSPVKPREKPPEPLADLRTRTTGDDWPQFLGPLGASVSQEKGIIAPWPKEGLRLVWQKTLGTSYGMPTISLGRLFQFDRYGDKARLTCLNAETGKFLWKFEYPTDYEDYYGYNNGPRCSPVVDDDRVYIYGAEGKLHCIRIADGELLWRVDTAARFGVRQNFFGVGSTPVVEGDLLLVMVGGSPPGDQEKPIDEVKSNGSALVAFDKRTGAVKYQAGKDLAGYAGPVLATIDKRRWCFLFARSGLIGLNPADGQIDFHFPWRAKSPESVNACNPVVVGDRVLITECYGPGSALLKVKPGGCDVVWSDQNRDRNKSLQGHWCTPIHRDGYVYGCSGRHENGAEIRCVELATGKVMWKCDEFWRTSLLLIDDHFLALDERGLLVLFKANPKQYEEVSRTIVRDPEDPGERSNLLRYPCWAAPILAHGLLYCRGKDRLVCLELIPAKK